MHAECGLSQLNCKKPQIFHSNSCDTTDLHSQIFFEIQRRSRWFRSVLERRIFRGRWQRRGFVKIVIDDFENFAIVIVAYAFFRGSIRGHKERRRSVFCTSALLSFGLKCSQRTLCLLDGHGKRHARCRINRHYEQTCHSGETSHRRIFLFGWRLYRWWSPMHSSWSSASSSGLSLVFSCWRVLRGRCRNIICSNHVRISVRESSFYSKQRVPICDLFFSRCGWYVIDLTTRE